MTKYPLTIKAAKAIAKQKLGRLPKMGHEVPVSEYPVKVDGFAYQPRLVTVTATLYLVNISGRFSLREYVPVP